MDDFTDVVFRISTVITDAFIIGARGVSVGSVTGDQQISRVVVTAVVSLVDVESSSVTRVSIDVEKIERTVDVPVDVGNKIGVTEPGLEVSSTLEGQGLYYVTSHVIDDEHYLSRGLDLVLDRTASVHFIGLHVLGCQ